MEFVIAVHIHAKPVEQHLLFVQVVLLASILLEALALLLAHLDQAQSMVYVNAQPAISTQINVFPVALQALDQSEDNAQPAPATALHAQDPLQLALDV